MNVINFSQNLCYALQMHKQALTYLFSLFKRIKKERKNVNHKNIFKIKLYKVTKITLFNFNVNSELPKSILIRNPVIKMLPKA